MQQKSPKNTGQISNLKILKVRRFLQTYHVDAVLISSITNIIYLTSYSGFSYHERDAYILITKYQQYLFTNTLYFEEVKTVVKDFQIYEINKNNPFPKLLTKLIRENNIQTLGIESDNLTLKEYQDLQKNIKIKFKSLSLSSLRIQKTDEEIKKINQACNLGDKAFDFILKFIRPGITEKDIAFEIETFIRKNGGEVAFPTIVGFGSNSAIPHHKTNNTVLRNNDIILIDFGVRLNNYCSDMTRTFFIGKPTQEQNIVYNIVRKAQKKALELLYHKLVYDTQRRYITAASLDKIVREYILSQGYPSIPHSLGHGIGIQVHEPPALSPTSKDKLTDGMVFSIEPGIYLPGRFGIRIEDIFAIQNSKLIQLTNASVSLLQI
ncbi:MAG: Xaa-Pro aminopeptidase [Patescibacteria group bacterium]|nr:MAG: Xaa-Pro aminopeptidase [Patescibacteria group bacterium]